MMEPWKRYRVTQIDGVKPERVVLWDKESRAFLIIHVDSSETMVVPNTRRRHVDQMEIEDER